MVLHRAAQRRRSNVTRVPTGALTCADAAPCVRAISNVSLLLTSATSLPWRLIAIRGAERHRPAALADREREILAGLQPRQQIRGDVGDDVAEPVDMDDFAHRGLPGTCAGN